MDAQIRTNQVDNSPNAALNVGWRPHIRPNIRERIKLIQNDFRSLTIL